jgi:hypothetical protein
MRVVVFSVDERTGLLVDREFDRSHPPEDMSPDWWPPGWEWEISGALPGLNITKAIEDARLLMERGEFKPEHPYEFSVYVRSILYRDNGGPA